MNQDQIVLACKSTFRRHDARTGRLVTEESLGMRGDTDESWRRATRINSCAKGAGAQLRRTAAATLAVVSGAKPLGMPAQMIAHEGGDEIVAVVVAVLPPQREGNSDFLAGYAQKLGAQLLVEKLIGIAIVN